MKEFRCPDCCEVVQRSSNHQFRCKNCQEAHKAKINREFMLRKRQQTQKLGTGDLLEHREKDFDAEKAAIKREKKLLNLENPVENRKKFNTNYYWRIRHEYK